MTILVTGASGHVGFNLVQQLTARGERVRILIHESSLPPDGDIEVFHGDICDIESLHKACHGIDTVYHLAGRISIGAYDWEVLEKVNVNGTRNVIEACLKGGVRRLVHFSSIHAMVQAPMSVPVDESRSLASSKNLPCYDRSKAAGEIEVRKGIERGLDAVIINPTAIIGPNDYRSSYFGSAFLDMANGRLPALVGGGFDWVDVRDVAAGAILAADRAPAGAKYLLSGHRATIKEMAAVISGFTGIPSPAFVCPMWLAAGAVPVVESIAVMTKRQPLFTRDSMRALRTCNHNISHEKATRELGYQPRPFRETIQDTLHWYKERGLIKNDLFINLKS